MPEPWRIHFFQRHGADDLARAVPTITFLDSLPVRARAEVIAVLDAVAEAPPPAFSGGGKWEAMHGDMAGFYEIRARGADRPNHRLFCILEREAPDLGGASIVCIAGLSKPLREAAHPRDYRRVVALRGLVVALFALAAAGWWWTADQMQGMKNGPWVGLGTFGWFLSVWVVMMAAMMFPSVAPTVALYSRMTRKRSPLSPLIFATGYLITWAAAGVLAFSSARVVDSIWGDVLAWNRAGRWAAGATLILAAVYQLTPLKDVCLGKCRSPLGFLLGSWREGRSGALRMGAKNGAWCVGCCWALMAALFALGIMSLAWMAVVAGLIAAEKTLPWRRVASHGTAAILLGLGMLVLIAPAAIPGLSTPTQAPMHNMSM